MFRRLLLVFSVLTLLALGAMGHGAPVVLVHGLGSTADDWLPLARDLARDHRVVLVELPGHGLAAMPRTLTLADAARALDAAITEQADQPVLLVGHSVGGLVTAYEALRSPGHVRALVEIETALRPQMTSPERDTLLARLDHDWSGTLHDVYASFGRDSAQGEALAARAAAMPRPVLAQWIRLALDTDLSGQAPMLSVPVLAVLAPHSWGPDESWPSVARALGYEGVPRCQGVRIDDCGHFVMLDRPATLAGAIRRFERSGSTPLVAAK